MSFSDDALDRFALLGLEDDAHAALAQLVDDAIGPIHSGG
jgi:hypothetical protein